LIPYFGFWSCEEEAQTKDGACRVTTQASEYH
jgi:hypothetical protein